jgi:hypothetical protein
VSYDPLKVIDFSVTADTLTEHIVQRKPCCRLRYGDGEWLSILGTGKRRNCDGHAYLTDTMGNELGQALVAIGQRHPDNRDFYVGLHRTWHQERIQQWVADHGLVDTVRWTSNLLLEPGLDDETLSTRRFLRAVRDYPGLTLLVTNAAVCLRLSRGLRAETVVAPAVNAYNEIDSLEERCAEWLFDELSKAHRSLPPLVLVSMGIPAEALIWRLYCRFPRALYFDTGHLLAAIAGQRIRRYLRANRRGIQQLIAEKYSPEFVL